MDVREPYVAAKERYDKMEYPHCGRSGLGCRGLLWGFGIILATRRRMRICGHSA